MRRRGPDVSGSIWQEKKESFLVDLIKIATYDVLFLKEN